MPILFHEPFPTDLTIRSRRKCNQIAVRITYLLVCCAIFSPSWWCQNKPNVPQGAVVNAAYLLTPVTAGSYALVFGSDLSSSSVTQSAPPWPTSLAGTSVQMNGVDVPLGSVSPSQVGFQVPWELAGQTQA